MAKIKYFGAENELVAIRAMDNSEFARQFPGVKGRAYDGFSKMVGIGLVGLEPVTRVIEYKSNPSLHKCDARCFNATGKIMRCECSCGGANHGKGAN